MVVVTLLATISIAGNVTLPYAFTAGTAAKASEVNGNFAAVKTAVDNNFSLIGALQTAVTTLQTTVNALTTRVTTTESNVTAIQNTLQGRVLYYAEQNSDLLVSTTGTWGNVPGASVTFSTSANSTNVLLTATGSLHQYAGPATWVRCGLRFLIDGQPIAGTDATRGNLEAAASAWDTPLDAMPFAMRESYSFGPGSHTVSVQMSRIPVTGVTASGECALFRWTYSRTHLTAESY
jgi:hypothetical protein